MWVPVAHVENLVTEYTKPSFSVHMPSSQQFRDNWEATFGGTVSDDLPEEQPVDSEMGALLDMLADGVMSGNVPFQVYEFHSSFGLPVVDRPTVPPQDRALLRLRLITEEYLELLEAHGIPTRNINEYIQEAILDIAEAGELQIDLVEAADALADLDYVIEGTRLEYGIDGGPVADEVHRANMSKLGEDGKPVYREDGKVTKGPNYTPPDIATIIELQKTAGES